MLNQINIEDHLSKLLDDCLIDGHFETAYNVLKVVEPTFSKFDYYMLKFSETHLPN